MKFRSIQGRKPWVLKVLMNQNSNECISLIMKHLKREGVSVQKEFEKKRLLLESEVTGNTVKDLQVDRLLASIGEYENKMETSGDPKVAKHLIALYNKAVEYYSALNEDTHMAYLMKLQKLFRDEKLQAAMERSDLGTNDPQSTQSDAGSAMGGSDIASVEGSINN
jgi:hypothetical protein